MVAKCMGWEPTVIDLSLNLDSWDYVIIDQYTFSLQIDTSSYFFTLDFCFIICWMLIKSPQKRQETLPLAGCPVIITGHNSIPGPSIVTITDTPPCLLPSCVRVVQPAQQPQSNP